MREKFNRRDFMVEEFGVWVTRITVGLLIEMMSTRNALGQNRASPNGILQYVLSKRCYTQT